MRNLYQAVKQWAFANDRKLYAHLQKNQFMQQTQLETIAKEIGLIK